MFFGHIVIIRFSNLFEHAVEVFAKFPDNGFFQKDIHGYFQFFSLDAAWPAHRFAGFVVDDFAGLCPGGLDGVEMAADGLLPGDLAVIVSLFDAAFNDAVGIPETVCAHFPFDGGGDPAEFPVVLVASAGLYLFDAGGGKIGFYDLVDGIYLVEFGFFQWGAGVAVFAAAAFAFHQIADELLADHVVTYQDVVDRYHCHKYKSFGGLEASGFPPETVDQVVHILFQELVYDPQGIFVRGRVEVEGSAQEMAGGVSDKELIGRGGVAADLEEVSSYSVGGLEDGVFDGARLVGVFKGHLEGVFAQLIEFVSTYRFVTDINACAEAGEVDVYPPGVLGDGIEKRTVLQDLSVNRVFERIGEAGLVEGLVLVGREVYLKITPSFGCVDTVAGKEESESEKKGGETGYRHDVEFDFLTLGLHSDGHFYFFYAAAVGIEDGEFKISAGYHVVYLWNIAA